MSGKKSINEQFFDVDSQAMYYVLGLLSGKSVPLQKAGMVLHSTSKDLVEIVRDHLESSHTITFIDQKTSSYRLLLTSVPHLSDRLRELGLQNQYEERLFPSVPERYLADFSRGFIESRGIFPKPQVLRINFRQQFLDGLNSMLQQYAGVERKGPTSDNITYSLSDSSRIYAYLYQDVPSLTAGRLLLPTFQQEFAPPPATQDKPASKATQRKLAWFAKAKTLADKGKELGDIVTAVGKSNTSVCDAFKEYEGKTFRRYQSEVLSLKSSEMVYNGSSFDEAATEFGVSVSFVQKAFRKRYHITPQEHRYSLNHQAVKQMVCEGFPVAAVAQTLDMKVFDINTFFFQQEGVTPDEFQKHHQHLALLGEAVTRLLEGRKLSDIGSLLSEQERVHLVSSPVISTIIDVATGKVPVFDSATGEVVTIDKHEKLTLLSRGLMPDLHYVGRPLPLALYHTRAFVGRGYLDVMATVLGSREMISLYGDPMKYSWYVLSSDERRQAKERLSRHSYKEQRGRDSEPPSQRLPVSAYVDPQIKTLIRKGRDINSPDFLELHERYYHWILVQRGIKDPEHYGPTFMPYYHMGYRTLSSVQTRYISMVTHCLKTFEPGKETFVDYLLKQEKEWFKPK